MCEQRFSREDGKAPGSDDPAVLGVALVVAFDLVQAVHVVHHQASRPAHAAQRGVAQPVQTLQAGAVAEMETRDRIERVAALLRVQQVMGAQPDQVALRLGPGALVLQPAGRVDPREQLGELGVLDRLFGQPSAKSGYRRQRREGLQTRKFAAEPPRAKAVAAVAVEAAVGCKIALSSKPRT